MRRNNPKRVVRNGAGMLMLVCLMFISCQVNSGPTDPKKGKMVEIETEFGNIKVLLYDETPLHRDNFLKLAGEHYFDSLLFHRVIKNFMIQGGDPDSKNAAQGVQLGNGGPSYTIPAEFNPMFFHKKGALAAARTGDEINPEKRSSGSQFYIVQGKVFSEAELTSMEAQMNQGKKFEIIRNFLQKPENAAFRTKVDSLQKARDNAGLNQVVSEIEALTKDEYEKAPKLTFTAEQKKLYSTLGGSPHLDGNYTVFGEVTEGLDVIDKIAAMEVDKNSRPTKDIRMKIKVLQ